MEASTQPKNWLKLLRVLSQHLDEFKELSKDEKIELLEFAIKKVKDANGYNFDIEMASATLNDILTPIEDSLFLEATQHAVSSRKFEGIANANPSNPRFAGESFDDLHVSSTVLIDISP
jgi:hypothetical protein